MRTVCIAGKHSVAISAASHVLQNYSNELLGCISESDDGLDGWQPSFRKWCENSGVEVVPLSKLSKLRDLLLFSLQFDKLIRVESFRSRDLFNIHFSDLPKYKGMYTSVWPILNNESTSGVTMHRIDRGIDTGDIVAKRVFPISPSWTARDLYCHYVKEAGKLFIQYFSRVVNGDFFSTPQSCQNASYYSRASIDFASVSVDLAKTAWEISAQIRAFTFPEYQFVRVFGEQATGVEILGEKSWERAGTLLEKAESRMRISTIDYDLIVHFLPRKL
jgi:methionyl-tRNA formyltransferase